ncbi:transcriptional regulator [Pseudomonas sp. CFBP 8771]|uniref:helix-turn-helix domain-containing protein n=1 Tax=Pseudomonas sp. CFBP 8771 TaxID=2775285 RepID=UPI000F0237E9|nr:transcriptional regulator [Pseudomonas sp. CFBP 8771]MBD8602506.1 transcriptional regulator [Pseudomonas sp. CFBP 8771]
MHIKIALAGTLRALRLNRRMRYEQLSEASGRSKISALERGETSITLEKFESLAEALEINPLALMALCMSARLDTPYQKLIEDAYEQLRLFEADGGMGLLSEQFSAGALVQRTRGKPVNNENLDAVQRLKSSGMTQAQIARELGLSATIVNRYWKRTPDQSFENT